MNRFEQELKNNNFICSECPKCKKLVWPPSDYCNRCFGDVIWRQVSRDAVLLEYSHKNGEYFCMAELEGQIRIIGTIKNVSKLQIGENLILEKCDYDGNEKFVFKPKKN
ncbi:MAG: hypothetical protein KGH99_01065 [Thaumarchaeota archaeon]|nr:hypothetical protein [Nitrososphaerota archaeon]